MFPLHDDNPTEILPIFTMLIIVACVAVWSSLQGAGLSEQTLVDAICAYGAIPLEVTGQGMTGSSAGAPCALGGWTWQALFSSMFMHASWMHLIGNMWFLWIFGNNVEDSMGHLRFLVFYLLSGLVAAGAHVLTDPASAIPMVGASGAISAVMGGYVVLYPRARVYTLFFFFVFVRVVPLPAWLLLAYWMFIQIASSALAPEGGGGVAYAAHVGGFLAGVVPVFAFRNPRLVRAKRSGVRLRRDQLEHGGWW